jgi:hypothetical protein
VARLIYSAIASLDGYVEDAEGRFDWAEPDEEVFCFVNVRHARASTGHKPAGPVTENVTYTITVTR